MPPVAVSVPTKFLREGIRYDDLSEEEKDDWDALEWDEDGDIPDAVAAEELNQFLFNADTVDKVLATLMTDGHKVAGGDRLGKTIIFAKNQDHAEFIEQRFDLNYPEYAGHFARVITHAVTYAQSPDRRLLDQGQGAAHRDLGRHARHRHRRARGRQPGLLQAGPVQDQVLADDRPRHPAVPGPVRARARTRRTSTSSTSARTSSSSARTCPAPRGRCRSPWPSGSSRPASGWSPRSTRPSTSTTGEDPAVGRRREVRARAARRPRLEPAPDRGRHEPRQLPGPPRPASGSRPTPTGTPGDAHRRDRPATSPATSPGCRRPNATTTRTPSGST